MEQLDVGDHASQEPLALKKLPASVRIYMYCNENYTNETCFKCKNITFCSDKRTNFVPCFPIDNHIPLGLLKAGKCSKKEKCPTFKAIKWQLI